MKKFIYKLLGRTPPRSVKNLKSSFCRRVGYEPNFDAPATFNEKINWLKLNCKNPLMTVCADKYAVRGFVEKKGFGKYLIPLLAVADSFDELDWGSLPASFVIKTNHDSGGIWRIRKKNSADKNILKKQISRKLKKRYGFGEFEDHYAEIPRKIIVEEMLKNFSGGDVRDYKFFCFNGRAAYIQVDCDRFTNHRRVFYDTDWNRMDFSLLYPLAKNCLPRPLRLKTMLETAEGLAKGFPFVRVDLYFVNSKIYFGEMTFTPEAGMGRFSDIEWDKKFGSLLKLP